MKKDKYALLDTDFISKMYSIQKDKENHLIDRIMELPRYQFYCHSQIMRTAHFTGQSSSAQYDFIIFFLYCPSASAFPKR